MQFNRSNIIVKDIETDKLKENLIFKTVPKEALLLSLILLLIPYPLTQYEKF
jgi:hypothetical protein